MVALLRTLLGLPAAIVITGGLFLFMAAMIRQDVRLEQEKDAVNINITAQRSDTDLSDFSNQIKPPKIDTPPPPPPNTVDASNRPSLDGVKAEVPQIEANVKVGTGINPDRDAQPLVRIPPQYPERCMSRAKAVENVTVEFDVNENGETVNPRVIETTNSCLNRAAMRSVGRWKYQPKIVEGKAEWRRGVVTTITFELAE